MRGHLKLSHVGSVLGDSLFFNLILRGPSFIEICGQRVPWFGLAGTSRVGVGNGLGPLKIE